MKLKGINHLAMITRDMDKTIRFWRDLLGMRMVAGLGKPGYRHYFLEISGNAMLAFFEWPKVEPVPEKDHGYPVAGPMIFDHVSFEVSGEEDLLEVRAALDAAGFWVSDIIDHGFIHSVYSFDPNGIAIEFSSTEGLPEVRKHPVMVDSAPSAVTLEGPDPVPGVWPLPPGEITDDDRMVFPGEGMEFVDGVKKNWWDR